MSRGGDIAENEEIPANVTFVRKTINELKTIASEKLGIPVNIEFYVLRGVSAAHLEGKIK